MSGMSLGQPEKQGEKPGSAALDQKKGAISALESKLAAMGPTGTSGGSPAADQESRLREVERKLDEILRRLDDRKPELPR